MKQGCRAQYLCADADNFFCNVPRMTIFEILVVALIAVYWCVSLLLLRGTFACAPPAFLREEKLPVVSVLIAARNEERRLPGCLESLLQSHYPADKLQIVVVNDRSADRTGEIAASFAQRDARVMAVTCTRFLQNMSGKANALCEGMQCVRGEIVLLTDADCLVPPHWVRAMVMQFTAEVGLVGGFTLLSPSPALRNLLPQSYRASCFGKIQTLDWMYLLTVGAGAAGLGKPVSILGNNFGFRRTAYEQIGGYEKLGFSIIEDFALMRKILEHTKWRMRFALNADTAIFSFPSPTWGEYVDQRRRWAAGGKEVGGFAKLLMLTAFFAHVILLFATVLAPSAAFFGGVAVLLMDGLLIWRGTAALRYRALLKYFPLFELYFILYSLVLALIVLFPLAVNWKGRRYRWNWRGKIKNVEEA